MDAANPGVLRERYGISERHWTGHAVADAYLYFHGAVSEWLAEESTEKGRLQRLDALYKVLKDQVRLVAIDLGTDDDAQMIFETLNARGTPLLPVDLIKNDLLHRMRLNGADPKKLGLTYEKNWSFFDQDSDYWREEIGRGHARRARVDNFFQFYLSARIKDEVPVAHLFTAFRAHVDADSQVTPDVHMHRVASYAGDYRKLEDREVSPACAISLTRIDVLGFNSVYPFLLELMHRFGGKPFVETVVADIESFLIRRTTCQLNTRGYNRSFIEAIDALEGPETGVVERVRTYLNRSKADSERWPDDNEFMARFRAVPLYRALQRKRVVMILSALELALRTKKTESVDLPEELTVEHILPQNWKAHWPLKEGVDAGEAEDERELLMHTVGNLTLLTESLNPAVSNGPWPRKSKGLKQHSVLMLNKELWELDGWDEDAIRARGVQLAQLANRIWPKRDAS
jgi:hypothetical protein